MDVDGGGEPFFSLVPLSSQALPGYRTFTGTLELVSGYRVRVLPPFMRSSPKALIPWGKLALRMCDISWLVFITWRQA